MQPFHDSKNFFFLSIFIHLIFFIMLYSYLQDEKENFISSKILESFLVVEKNGDVSNSKMAHQNKIKSPNKKNILSERTTQSTQLFKKSALKDSSPPRQDINNTLDPSFPSSLIHLLHEKILSKQHYPLIALEMKNEGTTTLKFTLLTNGKIKNVYIAKTSGTLILDKAALKALQDAAPFIEIAQYLKNQEEFEVEIQFHL